MRKWWAFFGAVCVLVSALAYGALCWAGAGWLTMPPRKPLADWQLEWLEHPAAHGMRIAHTVATDGTPYLLCEPDATAGPDVRGRTLRAQLAAAGIPPGRHGEIRGTLVLLHGWGMRKESLLTTAERFCAAGMRCVVPDLPGHGENPSPATSFAERSAERELPARVLSDAAARFHFASRPAALWGLSMGGAYALRAAERSTWDAVVVVSGFDELSPVVRGELSRHIGGWSDALIPGLNIAIALRSGFRLDAVRPLDSARALRSPIFVVHGAADPLISENAGRRLYQAIPHARKRWLEVTGAEHGNVLGTPQHVFCEMAAWMLRGMTKSKLPAPARVARILACPTPTPVN
jgi:pimeloyl-ACP methyl ester carboxylesterase